MKKRILSVMSSLVMAGCILGTSSVAVNAQENEKIVDGSALTTNDTSTGRTENGMGYFDSFVEMKETDYFVYATKTVTVDRGYYYRVCASHIVRKGDDPVEETYSFTNGIKVP